MTPFADDVEASRDSDNPSWNEDHSPVEKLASDCASSSDELEELRIIDEPPLAMVACEDVGPQAQHRSRCKKVHIWPCGSSHMYR